MQKLKHKGKVLFVFSDPGGAKPCLSLMSECDADNVLAVSDRVYSFYDDFKLPVTLPVQNYDEIIISFKPDLIFTGTSYKSSIEKEFIALAQKLFIPSWSFVDHWTSISARFRDGEGLLNLPDMVWVIDERAKNIAVSEGIDANKILITGNPYHNWLTGWKPEKTRNQFLETIGITDQGKKIIVFAPDPLSNVNGKLAYGFDEFTASAKLVELLNKNYAYVSNWLFLIKMHPNQNVSELSKIFSKQECCKLLTSDVNTNETIFFADVVIGFFSSLLLEADIMGKPIVRFLDSESNNDPFEKLDIGHKADEDRLIFQIANLL